MSGEKKKTFEKSEWTVLFALEVRWMYKCNHFIVSTKWKANFKSHIIFTYSSHYSNEFVFLLSLVDVPIWKWIRKWTKEKKINKSIRITKLIKLSNEKEEWKKNCQYLSIKVSRLIQNVWCHLLNKCDLSAWQLQAIHMEHGTLNSGSLHL